MLFKSSRTSATAIASDFRTTRAKPVGVLRDARRIVHPVTVATEANLIGDRPLLCHGTMRPNKRDIVEWDKVDAGIAVLYDGLQKALRVGLARTHHHQPADCLMVVIVCSRMIAPDRTQPAPVYHTETGRWGRAPWPDSGRLARILVGGIA